jgi:UDP-N-acetyl-2-amino-2-deoxyglucuronate dehydrogenase
MTNVGVIGAGIIFADHARAIRELGDRARLVAVADLDEHRRAAAAAEHGIAHACADHRELIALDEVDVVTVCTPPAFHEDVVIDALRAGKTVLCEKPLAHTLEACDRIIEAARDLPGRLSVIHQYRYLPEVLRTTWLRDTGRLGPLLFGRFSRLSRFHDPSKLRRSYWGSFDVAGGGLVMTQLIHELDLMCHIMGAPVEVSAVVDTRQAPIASEDTCAATVRFANGAMASVYGTMCAQHNDRSFEVLAARGSTHSPWTVRSLDEAWRAEAQAAADAAVDAREGEGRHTAYFRAVLDALDTGAPLPVPAEDARVVVELCAAIYESGITGRPVALPLEPTSLCYSGVSQDDYDARRDSGVAA